MNRKIKVIVSNNDIFGDRSEKGKSIMTGDGVEYVEFEKEQLISEKCYNNLKSAVPIEWFMNEDSKSMRKTAISRFKIQKMGDFVEDKEEIQQEAEAV